jgi:predicted nucleic acid-binding Zn ribbon protein
MKKRHCAACREPLPTWVRIDKVTCNGACRTRLYRQRKDARDTCLTGSRAVAHRASTKGTKEAAGDLGDVNARFDLAGQLDLWIGQVRP